ncbi:MAG: hypothetical protein MUO26_15975, partial [Methanotrichaceae archaeon]|nr:hypothetical protein [Methanotrichaceae archaeon]
NIIEYLSMELPAPFDDTKFKFAGDINNWLVEKGVIFSEAEIIFNNEKIYRPPYNDQIFLDCIIKKEFLIKNEVFAVGWFITGLENEKLKMPNNGIVFKKKGFTIGDSNLVLRQFGGMYHPWQYGEIHIISNQIRENAARNNFEYNSANVLAFFEEIGKFIGYLEQLNRYKSQRNAPKLIRRIKETPTERILDEIKNIKKRFKSPISFPKDPSLVCMKGIIDSESKTELDDICEFEAHFVKKTNKNLCVEHELSPQSQVEDFQSGNGPSKLEFKNFKNFGSIQESNIENRRASQDQIIIFQNCKNINQESDLTELFEPKSVSNNQGNPNIDENDILQTNNGNSTNDIISNSAIGKICPLANELLGDIRNIDGSIKINAIESIIENFKDQRRLNLEDDWKVGKELFKKKNISDSLRDIESEKDNDYWLNIIIFCLDQIFYKNETLHKLFKKINEEEQGQIALDLVFVVDLICRLESLHLN